MKLKTVEKLQNLSHIVANYPLKIHTPPFENLSLPLQGIFSIPLPFGDFWKGSTTPFIKGDFHTMEMVVPFVIVGWVLYRRNLSPCLELSPI